jgi:hypothetical protein
MTLFSRCEKDDFCIKDPVTPMLVLRFYDATDRDKLKDTQRLSIWTEGKDTISDYKSVTTDSVAIPLNSTALETIYHLKINTLDGNLDSNQATTFTIQYTPEEEFVSRSCGFRVLFNDVTFSHDNTWIQDFTPSTPTTIDNQSAAHVQIYH